MRMTSLLNFFSIHRKRCLRNRFVAQMGSFVTLLFMLSGIPALTQDQLVGLASAGGPNRGGTAFSLLSNGTGFSLKTAFVNAGKFPYGDLVQGADGNFYGMTGYGGMLNGGTIFKITPAGTMTILKSLDDSTGYSPYGSLIKAADGNFYGMTAQGGAHYSGTIFKITPAGVCTVFRSLDDSTGKSPYGNLVQHTDGNFYGTMQRGGRYNYGTIFQMTLSGKVTVLKNLDKTLTGANPNSTLVQGTDGALYGTARDGGSNGLGVLFKITTAGLYTLLKNLDSTSGSHPYGSLTKASDGNFYGLTNQGGSYGYGSIFKLTSSGSFTVIKHLDNTATGGNAYGSLLQATDKFLYGMTSKGGLYGYGTIFKTALDGTFTVLKNLRRDSASGYNAFGSLMQGTDGALYGMTHNGGGSSNAGVIFKITTGGIYTMLAALPDAGKGYAPRGNLIQAANGYFYGTSHQDDTYGNGTAYKFCTGKPLDTLASFEYSATGGNLEAGLIQGADGYFYGMAHDGGNFGAGTVYKISPAGAFTILKHLDPATSGGNPYGNLVQGSDGALYGMTNQNGTIFKIMPTGGFTILLTLNDYTGMYPCGGLAKGTDGNFYGMTTRGGTVGDGTIFKLTPAGALTVLKNLDYSTTGKPNVSNEIMQNSDGNFYGMMYQGGMWGMGLIFKMNPSGTFTILKEFRHPSDSVITGYSPQGSLIKGSDGFLYGMATKGGKYNGGTIFKINSSGGSFTILRHLNPATDGGFPTGSLIIQKPNPKATTQSIITKEDTAKAITLSGMGGVPLTYAISTAPKNGTLSGSGANRIYKPKANFNGRDSFYFKATWGCQTSSSAKVLLTVTQVNDTPVLAPIGNRTIAKGATLTFTATATDVDSGQTKTYSLINAPAGATISSGTGVFSWKPTATGSYVFKIRITDNGSPVLYDEESFVVTVTNTAVGGNISKQEKADNMEPEPSLSLKAAPNPTTSFFTLEVQGNSMKPVTLKVFNVLGSVVEARLALPLNKTIRFGQNYKPGTYMVEVQQGSAVIYTKLIKQ